jgi:hypothetical protein
MARVAPYQSSFNAGEFTPLLFGQVSYDKYANALALCENYIPLVQGGLTRRPGTFDVAATKYGGAKSSRLVRFEFSTTQAYILEFGDLYIRFYANGGQVESSPGTPLEVITTYAEADLAELRFTQSNDVLYITHPDYAPRKLSRLSAMSWTIGDIAFLDGPYLPTNTSSTTISLSARSGSVTATASVATFASTDVGRAFRIGYYPPQWAGSTAYAKGATVKNDSGKIYVCIQAGTSASSGGPTGFGNSITDGTCKWNYSVDASMRWAWGTITGYTSTTAVTVMLTTPAADNFATQDWRLGIWGSVNGYPAVSTFYEDRLVFAGCPQYPQRVDFSCVSQYETFSPTNDVGVTSAAEAISYTLNSKDVQVVRWLEGDEKGLLVGTTSGEWIIRPSTQGEALSATNVKGNQSSGYGSANVAGVRADRAVLYVQRAGRKLRELAYVLDVDGFKSPDMTVRSEHITRGGLLEGAFQKELKPIVWLVRADGVLLGMTYERDQDVIAWHKHTLGGADAVVESVASIPSPDGTRDDLWLQVRRTINGATSRRVEVLTKIWEVGDEPADAIIGIDSAGTYDGSPTTTVTGLDWLEGETVQIWADAAVHPEQVVTGGEITLQTAASKVQVGLGYASRAQTLRNNAGSQNGTAQGKIRRIDELAFRLLDTIGLKFGPTFDDLEELIFRKVGDAATTAVPLFTGDKQMEFSGDYDFDGIICWEQSQPTPGTILALMPHQTTYDG